MTTVGRGMKSSIDRCRECSATGQLAENLDTVVGVGGKAGRIEISKRVIQRRNGACDCLSIL
jgi:hypothetical protein